MPPCSQFCLVILSQNPTGLHAGGFTFLKSAVLASFPGVFVNLAFQVVGTLQYGSVTVDCPPEECPTTVASDPTIVEMFCGKVTTNVASGSFWDFISFS